MPKTKHFRLRLSSKLKKTKLKFQVHSLLSPGCGLLKTTSFAVDRNQLKINGQVESPNPKDILIESHKYIDTPKNLKGTHRFFVHPSESNSLIEDRRFTGSRTPPIDSSMTLTNEAMRSARNFEDPGMIHVNSRNVKLLRESIALMAYSMEPYKEFRQSMMEMVASRIQQNLTIDWNYLEELVMCYLELNDKHCYEHILNAFAGLTVELYQISGQIRC